MNRIRKFIIAIFLIALALPLILYIAYLFGPFLPRALDLTNSDWLSFYGSYYGGLLGGFATFIALYYTLKYERNRTDRERIENDIQNKKERIKDITTSLGMIEKALSFQNIPRIERMDESIGVHPDTLLLDYKNFLSKLDDIRIDTKSLYTFGDNLYLLDYLSRWNKLQTKLTTNFTLISMNANEVWFNIDATRKFEELGEKFADNDKARFRAQNQKHLRTINESIEVLNNIYDEVANLNKLSHDALTYESNELQSLENQLKQMRRNHFM